MQCIKWLKAKMFTSLYKAIHFRFCRNILSCHTLQCIKWLKAKMFTSLYKAIHLDSHITSKDMRIKSNTNALLLFYWIENIHNKRRQTKPRKSFVIYRWLQTETAKVLEPSVSKFYKYYWSDTCWVTSRFHSCEQ